MEMSPRIATYDIPVERIKRDPNQPRRNFNPDGIDNLAQSIVSKGLLNPISVRPDGENFVILFGERRWWAAKKARRDTMRCLVWDGSLSEAEILERQLIEAEQRKNLDPMELAAAHQRLLTRRSCTRRQLAQTLQISESDVTRSLALLNLPTEVQENVASGALSASTAYEISRLPTQEAQLQLARRAVNDGLTRDRVTLMVQQALLIKQAINQGSTPAQVQSAMVPPTKPMPAPPPGGGQRPGSQPGSGARQAEPPPAQQADHEDIGTSSASSAPSVRDTLEEVQVTFGLHLSGARRQRPISVHVASTVDLTPAQRLDALRRAYEQEKAVQQATAKKS